MIISRDVLYLRVSDINRELYRQHGSNPFVYIAQKGKTVTLSYWELPAEVMDNPEKVHAWVELSVRVVKAEKKRFTTV